MIGFAGLWIRLSGPEEMWFVVAVASSRSFDRKLGLEAPVTNIDSRN